MRTNALFGSYWVAESPLHQLDPRTKLVGTIVLIITLFCATIPLSLGMMVFFVILLFISAHIPLLQALRSIIPLLFIVVLTVLFNVLFVQEGNECVNWGWLRITDEGAYTALFVGVRLTLLLLLGSLLTMTTTTLDITEAFERMLMPFARIGVPAHEFALIMGIALRFLPQFIEEFQVFRTAQIARGAKLKTSVVRSGMAGLMSLLVPLFTSAFRHAETLSVAMEARCYHGSIGRTRLNALVFTIRDFIAALILVILFFMVLIVSTYA